MAADCLGAAAGTASRVNLRTVMNQILNFEKTMTRLDAVTLGEWTEGV